MATWKDIKAENENPGFYPDYEYVDIKEMVNREFAVHDVTAFENDKGPGAAFTITFNGNNYKMVTHSIGVVKTVTSDAFICAVAEEPVVVTLKEGKSKKSGKYFYYLE